MVIVSSPDPLGSIFISLDCPSAAAKQWQPSPGDCSWMMTAMSPGDDLEWIPSLPLGQKIVVTNHWGLAGGILQNHSPLSHVGQTPRYSFPSGALCGMELRIDFIWKPCFYLVSASSLSSSLTPLYVSSESISLIYHLDTNPCLVLVFAFRKPAPGPSQADSRMLQGDICSWNGGVVVNSMGSWSSV